MYPTSRITFVETLNKNMKLRWREHEALSAITLVIAMFIQKVKYLETFQNENGEKYPNFDAVFNYYLPQIAICTTILWE